MTSPSVPLRGLPRLFVPGYEGFERFELPKDEVEKLRKVLRLQAGAHIAVLPNDGRILRCEFRGREAIPLEEHRPDVEADYDLTVAQALPKGDKLDEIIRVCTSLGVNRFILFSSERTVVRWDADKLGDRVRRLETIAREAAEVSFRTRLPRFETLADLDAVLKAYPSATVLSEVEGESRPLRRTGSGQTIVVGPEGGWSPKEVAVIGDRGVTLGPRVLRVEHAGAAAAAVLLLQN